MSDFETIKQRADIVDVVGQYVSLQRSGRTFKACCPFHQEKTPSFHVDPARQSWHCFGSCSTGGDVIRFIEKKENLSPVEALRLLAARYGVQLSERRKGVDAPATSRLIEAHEAAAAFFHHLLLNAEPAATARAYLNTRGLDGETVRAFQLGYSPDAWDALGAHLRGRGFTQGELEQAGLVTRGERGVYDRFRGRLMFPIRDERGRCIGFGGRVIGEGLPKYLNSPQTALFDKGATLYALDLAKDAIRAAGSAIVVEGYVDAITAHQFGIQNVVATLGTALTERHVALLKRYTRQVVLAMDADAAGIEAALRGEEVVRKAAETDPDAPARVVVDWRNLVRVQAGAPVEVRVFTVPQGKDPDEAIRADPDAFRELTRRAVPPFEFRLTHELRTIDRTNPRERRALAERLLPLVAGIADRAMQAQYLSRLAQAVAIPEEVLAAELSRRAGPGASGAHALVLAERVPRPNAPGPPRHAGTRPGRPAPAPPAAWDEPSLDALPPDEMPPRTAEAPPTPAAAAPTQPGGGDDAPGAPAAPHSLAPDTRLPGLKIERSCLRLLFSFASLRDAGMAIEVDLFVEPDHRALFLAWQGGDPTTLAERLDENQQMLLTRVLGERLPPYDEPAARRALDEIVARLRHRRLEDQSRLIAAAMRETETEGGAALVSRVVASLAGEPAFENEAEVEAATQLLTSVELAQTRHALEVELRTRATHRPAGP